MIEEYKFGSIKIEGKTYNYDVEVRWNGEVLKWWRKESHFVYPEDVKRAIEQNPEVIIIGTGESGVMEVGEKAKKEIEEKEVKLIINQTEKAIKTFNTLLAEPEEEKEKQKKVIGLFHLTC